MTEEQKKKMKQLRSCQSFRQRQRHLPEEIIFEILSLLSSKSLCRFQSVSRMWQSMIQSPSFVSAHRARLSNPKLLICQYDGDDSHVFSTAYPIPIPENNVKDASMDWRSHGRTPSLVFASEGGLICSYNLKREEIHVTNPITGERISSRTPPLLFPESYIGSTGCKVCFGYDPVENKHKVLVVRMYRLESNKTISTVDIFTVGGAEAWRRIINPSGLPDDLLFLCPKYKNNVCIDGSIYMVGRGDNPKFWLMSFDVRMETFRAIPVPAQASYGLFFCSFGFGRAPALIEEPYKLYGEDGEEIKFRVWKLDDFCRQRWSYWDFVPSSSSFSYPVDFVGVTSYGDVIFSHTPPKESTVNLLTLYLYRLESSTIKTLYGPNAGCSMLTAFYHIENLQPLALGLAYQRLAYILLLLRWFASRAMEL